MADAALTDATRDALFRRLGYLGGLHRALNLMQRSLIPVNTTTTLAFIINGDEDGTSIFDIKINRAKIRTDTNNSAEIFGTITDGGGGTGHSVTFYNDQARTTAVATIATVDNGDSATIVPNANFFLSGTMQVGTITGNVNFAIFVVPPAYQRIDDEFDGTQEEDGQIEQELKSALSTVRSSLETGIFAIRNVASSLMLTMFTRHLVTSSSDNTLINPNLSTDSNGGVIEEPRGRLEDLRQAMVDNTGGSGEIRGFHRTPVAVVGGIQSWNPISPGITVTDRIVPGSITFTCTKTLDATAPTFTAVFTPTDPTLKLGPNFSQDIPAEFELTVGQPWKSQTLGIASFTANYRATITNTVGASLNTTDTNWSVSGLTTANSDDGKSYSIYNASDTSLRFYDSSTNRDANGTTGLVAQVINPGTSSAFTATGTAGITISGTTGATLNNLDAGTVDWDPPQAVLPFDYFTVQTSVTETSSAGVPASVLQRQFIKGFVGSAFWYINTDGNTPNITDDFVTAGQFPGGRFYGDFE